MPRIVNIPSSDNSSSEEELIQVTPAPLPQQRSMQVGNDFQSEEIEEFIDCTMYSTNMVSYDEDEVYCLSRIIDGKIRKFKKDTRIWLHKSSDKAKLKRGIENLEQTLLMSRHRVPVNYSAYAQQRTVSDTVVDQENGKLSGKNGNCGIETHSEENLTRQQIIGPMVEFYDAHDDNMIGNSNFKETHNPVVTLDDEMSYLGDSDADITYSEEDTPKKTLSFVDDWRQRDEHQISSNSSNSIVAINTDRYPSVHSLTSADSFRGDESFEELDLCNESGNSIRPCREGAALSLGVAPLPEPLEPLDPRDVPRKIAPAIEMERESYRESVLDCAVWDTMGAGRKQGEEGAMYSDSSEMHRKNRSRAGSRADSRVHIPETSSRRPAGGRRCKHGTSASRPRDCTAVTSSYCLRSRPAMPGGPCNSMEEARSVPKSAGIASSKSPCKRLRFNDQIKVEPAPPGLNKQQDGEPVARAPPEPEADGATNHEAPSCSKDGGAARKRVPSLFVIAGQVLYGVYKRNFGR